MRRQSLKFKVGLYLTIGLMVAMVVFTVVVVRHQRDELLNEAASHVTQLSEVIIRSTRFAMLQNQPAYVDKILQDVGSRGHHRSTLRGTRQGSNSARCVRLPRQASST
jgi:two-component system, NtrC family, sensor kinase